MFFVWRRADSGVQLRKCCLVLKGKSISCCCLHCRVKGSTFEERPVSSATTISSAQNTRPSITSHTSRNLPHFHHVDNSIHHIPGKNIYIILFVSNKQHKMHTSPTAGRSSSSSLMSSTVPSVDVVTVTTSSPKVTESAGPSVSITTAICKKHCGWPNRTGRTCDGGIGCGGFFFHVTTISRTSPLCMK